MHIVYLHQYFNTPTMSGGSRSYEMARRLVSMGHEVSMVTSLREPGDRKHWFITVESGIRVHWLPLHYSNQMSYAERISVFFKFAFSSARKAASIPADVIFATSTPLTIVLPAVYAARRQSVPLVFEVRDLWPELPIAMGALRNPITIYAAKLLERFAYSSAEEIVALSPGMAEGVIRTGVSVGRVTQIPNGADLELFSPNHVSRKRFRSRLGISQEKILVVYAGSFGRINGVDYLPKLASALINDERFYFLTVGGGLEFTAVQSIAERLGVLGRNYQMLSRVAKQDIAEVLASADIACSLFIALPEMEANSANKFFDGLASGCCLAINYGGWQSDLLQTAKAGIKLDLDVKVAAQQLQELAGDKERLAKIKGAARELAAEKFSRDSLADILESVLARAIRGSSKRHRS